MKTKKIKKAGFSLMVALMLTASHSFATESWEKVDSKSGITIYERWVNITKDLSVKERKGEMTIPGSMNSVICTLCDPSKTKLWMENVSDAYLIKKESENIWSSYTYFSLPWPFESRDLVAVSKLNYLTPTMATIEMISKDNTLPEKKNVKRFMNYKAIWKIADLGNGNIYLSFSAISYTAPEFPRFIQDPVVRGAFLRNLLNLKVILCH